MFLEKFFSLIRTYSSIIRSSHRWRLMKKDVLINFAKITEKHLCQSLFFNEVAESCNFIKNGTPALVFSYEYCEIFKNNFDKEQLQATSSVSFFYTQTCYRYYRLKLFVCSFYLVHFI